MDAAVGEIDRDHAMARIDAANLFAATMAVMPVVMIVIAAMSMAVPVLMITSVMIVAVVVVAVMGMTACRRPGALLILPGAPQQVALPSLVPNLPSVKSRLVPTILPSLKSTAGSWKPLVPVARNRS